MYGSHRTEVPQSAFASPDFEPPPPNPPSRHSIILGLAPIPAFSHPPSFACCIRRFYLFTPPPAFVLFLGQPQPPHRPAFPPSLTTHHSPLTTRQASFSPRRHLCLVWWPPPTHSNSHCRIVPPQVLGTPILPASVARSLGPGPRSVPLPFLDSPPPLILPRLLCHVILENEIALASYTLFTIY